MEAKNNKFRKILRNFHEVTLQQLKESNKSIKFYSSSYMFAPRVLPRNESIL